MPPCSRRAEQGKSLPVVDPQRQHRDSLEAMSPRYRGIVTTRHEWAQSGPNGTEHANRSSEKGEVRPDVRTAIP